MSRDIGFDLVDEVVDGFRTERPDLDPRAIETACRMIYSGRVAQAHAERILKRHGLNYTDLDVLGNLRRSGSPFAMSPAALLRQAMITSGSMTSCLDRLEQAKLVIREIRQDDRRGRIVRLTDEGRALIDEALTSRFGSAARAAASLTTSEIDALNALMRKFADALNREPSQD
ncbi:MULTISPECIES: MarR family winged helix-turn-helix transcriptional regulator [Hyphobacterium]|uniref:MarR family winged helix-turn-helix transcriptional regulator n=1 Tax=Hyphobacterium vulgare TaxID=1736751 RepID=A0ABV6ZZP3_9PROT